MRLSTLIILFLGAVPLLWSIPIAIYDQIAHPPSWDIEFTYAVMGIAIGLFFVGVGLLKWYLLDFLLDFPF
jgi:hypothetical protein